MNNSLFDYDLTKTLPTALKNDKAIMALARVMAKQLRINAFLTRQAIIFARIDELDEAVIDVLAYDLHVDWYDDTAPLDVKRTVLKESVQVHRYMGTKWAVETLLGAYFGDVTVLEWFEYGGEPFHFRLQTNNPDATGARRERFLRLLEVAKRKSAWLDGITVNISGDNTAHIAITYATHSHETYHLF